MVAPCDGSERQRWRYVPGTGGYHSLASAQGDDCVEAGGGGQPIVFRCLLDDTFLGQRLTIRENGWVEIPRFWTDNGRKRAPARCLDSRPLPPVEAYAAERDAAQKAGVEWEQIW